MFKTLKLEDDILKHEIFKLAFVHKSSSIQHNNERLEYLGDAVLQLTISANVSNIFHSATEGELTRIRAKLVNTLFLSKKCQDELLHKHIQVSKGTENLEQSKKDKIYAGLLEAVIGAIFQIKGWDYSKQFLETLFKQELKNISMRDAKKDPKTELQEYLQKYKFQLPIYDFVEDKDNNLFECKVTYNGITYQSKQAIKKLAEQEVAQMILDNLDS